MPHRPSLRRSCSAPRHGPPHRLLHVEHVPARVGTAWAGRGGSTPSCATRWRTVASSTRGRTRSDAAEHARAGRHVVVATGTASGKSLAYLMPALTAVLEGTHAPNGRGATALYLSPTKALAHDQLALDRRARARPAAGLGVRRRHPRTRSANGSGSTPATCSPTPTCCTARCCRGTSGGRRSCASSATSSSTSATSTAACSARTWPTCCGGCGGSASGTAPPRPSCWPRPRRPIRRGSASRLTGLPVVAVTDDASPRGATGSRSGSRRSPTTAARTARPPGAPRRRRRRRC